MACKFFVGEKIVCYKNVSAKVADNLELKGRVKIDLCAKSFGPWTIDITYLLVSLVALRKVP